MSKIEKDWEVDGAVDTLIRAHEILNDQKLYPKVKVAFVKKQQALQDAALEMKITKKVNTIRERGD